MQSLRAAWTGCPGSAAQQRGGHGGVPEPAGAHPRQQPLRHVHRGVLRGARALHAWLRPCMASCGRLLRARLCRALPAWQASKFAKLQLLSQVPVCGCRLFSVSARCLHAPGTCCCSCGCHSAEAVHVAHARVGIPPAVVDFFGCARPGAGCGAETRAVHERGRIRERAAAAVRGRVRHISHGRRRDDRHLWRARCHRALLLHEGRACAAAATHNPRRPRAMACALVFAATVRRACMWRTCFSTMLGVPVNLPFLGAERSMRSTWRPADPADSALSDSSSL